MVNVVLPELAEGVDKAVVACWHYGVGDEVNEGDDLVEMATDKASFNVPAPASGVVKEVSFEEGDEVKVGQTLATIDEK